MEIFCEFYLNIINTGECGGWFSGYCA